ncbi:MAG TPA: transporter substrate-binding domain-containing protein [Lentimicrobium sp.]|nr:transporter substrate-binding domain-containing protein [Lentimicrobium sp.]
MYHRLINYLTSGIIILFILFIPESCSFSSDQALLKDGQTGGLLKDIQSRGTLVALVDDNPFNYFTFEGETQGFQYDLLKMFAEHLGVRLEVVIEPNIYKALQYIQQRRVDIIAMELPRITDGNFDITYTDPLYYDYQVLVQRKPENWFKMSKGSDYNKLLIKDIAKLKNKTVSVPANKQPQFYLSDLQHLTSNQVNLEAEKTSSVSDLIADVADGNVAYCLAYQKTAEAMSLTYSDIDINTKVSPRIGISWIVRKGAVNLLEETNQWIDETCQTAEFRRLKAKYFRNPRWVNIALGKPVQHRNISDYDHVIRELSSKIGWDWRLVAALIYHESKFDADVTSRRGAFGLMQLMPSTASKFGAHRGSSPNEQIAAGIRLLNYLDKRLAPLVPNKTERKKFVLAAYNIGLAHILDARNLAEKYGKDPTVWVDNVEYFLLAKSQPKYYNDSIVKYGRVSGKETHRFVLDVMDRYEHYKTLALR